MQRIYNRSRKYKKSKKSKKSKTIKRRNRKIYLGGAFHTEMTEILSKKYPKYKYTKEYTNTTTTIIPTRVTIIMFDMIKAFSDGVFTENQTYNLNDQYQAVIERSTVPGGYGGSNVGKLQFIIKDKLNPGNKPRIFWTEGQINP